MTRLTRKMRWKLAVWQEAYGLARQTQRLFNKEFGINSAPKRRTINAIHRKFMETECCTLRQESQILLKSVVSR